MIDSNCRFQPNLSQIAASIIDGETVIVDLSNGNYYSMDGTGTDVRTMIEQRRPLEEMYKILAGEGVADANQIKEDVQVLIGKLLAENVIEAAEAPPDPPAPFAPSGENGYRSPVLHVYRDMRDLLALDPPMPGLRDIPWSAGEKKNSAEAA